MIIPVLPLPFGMLVDKKDIKKAAKGFEAILWEMVLREAFKTLPKHSIFRVQGEMGIYREFMLWSLSNYMADSFNTDIGDKIYEKFSQRYLSFNSEGTINNIEKKA